MPDAIWVDRNDELPALARTLESQSLHRAGYGISARAHVLSPSSACCNSLPPADIWCVDTLRGGSLDPLVPALTAPQTRKVIHAARQDLEAFYLTTKRVISPVFDTQIAAGCIGLKPQVGYAELVKTLLDVTIPKGQTRTDWSKRPLTREQLDYAADDVLYLGEIADRLTARLQVNSDASSGPPRTARGSKTRGSTNPSLLRPGNACAASGKSVRHRGRAPRASPSGARSSRASAICREPGSFPMRPCSPWRKPIPRRAGLELGALDAMPPNFNDAFAESLLKTLREDSAVPVADLNPEPGCAPHPRTKSAVIERLAKIVDARAAELQVSAELLAPRGELKALAMGKRDTHAMGGWRRRGDRRTAAANSRLGRSVDRRGLHRVLDALEHHAHLGVRVHHAQQALPPCST